METAKLFWEEKLNRTKEDPDDNAVTEKSTQGLKRPHWKLK